jgi:hypothetical protein
MRRSLASLATLLLLQIGGLACPHSAHALWALNGVPLTPAGPGGDYPSLAPDGAGGFILVWNDAMSVLAQRFTPAPAVQPGWPAGGVTLFGPTSFGTFDGRAQSNTSAGAIVTIQYNHGGAHFSATQVSSTGAIPSGWPAGGCSDCPGYSVVPDGSGGTFASWRAYSEAFVSVDHRSAAGVETWARNVTNQGYFAPALARDGVGGVVLAWPCDFQRYDGTGGLAADPGTLPGCSGPATMPAIVSDGAGGAFVAWGHDQDVLLVRLADLGDIAMGWDPNGQTIGHAATPVAIVTMVADGAGGVFVAWWADGLLYAQRVTGPGAIASGWPALGVAVAPDRFTNALFGAQQELPTPVPDGTGGVFLTWMDASPNGSSITNIVAQHLLGDGTAAPGWGPGGSPICMALENQTHVTQTTDGAGGVFIAWSDARGPYTRIFGQHVLHDDGIVLAAPEPSRPEMLSLRAPNPVRGDALSCAVTLPSSEAAHLSVFDLAGRKRVSRELGSLGPGTHWVRLDGHSMRGGIYWVRLDQGAQSASLKLVIAD